MAQVWSRGVNASFHSISLRSSMCGSALIENTEALPEKDVLRQYTHYVVPFLQTTNVSFVTIPYASVI